MFDKITRFEVIDENGRQYVRRDCKIEASLQDEGRTLKIFVKEKDSVCPTCDGRGIVQVEYDNGIIESESCNNCNGTGLKE